MVRLLATSPVGKNGQTVIPASIRRMFRIHQGRRLVGFFSFQGRIEIAPVDVTRGDFSPAEIDKLESLSREKGGRSFVSAAAAKRFLKSL
jgi:bifunctional DNA-binding transcriptional regulator/antitoxin component of YhaV-PrlF toxin-antitoxin module